MKYASIKVLVLVLSTGGLIAACASGSDSPEFGSGSSGGGTSMATSTSAAAGGGNGGNGGVGGAGGGDVVSTSTGTGSGQPGDGGISCIPKCNADSDCQNSCPATQTGINCCDTDTNLCYVASTPMCPAPPTDGGPITPPY